MPQYLYKSKYLHTKEVDWLVAICRKRQEYIIFKEYWKLGDEVLDELKNLMISALKIINLLSSFIKYETSHSK